MDPYLPKTFDGHYTLCFTNFIDVCTLPRADWQILIIYWLNWNSYNTRWIQSVQYRQTKLILVRQ